MKWQTKQNAGERSYCYTYDNLNQFIQASYLEKENGLWTRNPGRYDVSGITYDCNGNIQTLDRNGLTGTQGGNNTFGQMDGLTYTYSGNQLKAVQDDIANSGTGNNDFKDNGSYGTVEYEYDNNGNLVSDDNKGIQSISYNHLNLPVEIVFSSTKKIDYLYAADGTKLKETITDGQMTHTFDYCGNMVYEDGDLSYILNPAGRALPTETPQVYEYEYFLRDHLGNVRVVFGDPDRDHVAEVIQENHYYPFGMTMGGLNYSAGLENRYLYQGKETTRDFNLWWSDFHARRFDSQLGRWHVPDPAGQFASAYVGMGNNPVNLTDPNGRWAVGGPWYWSEGYKQAERTVENFQKQLMESFSTEEVEREMQRQEMRDYAQRQGIGQGDSELDSDATGSDDPPGGKDQQQVDGKDPSSNSNYPETHIPLEDDWSFYVSVWGTLLSESARGNLPYLSITTSILGGGIGTYDNIKMAVEAYQEGDMERFWFETSQATIYVGGTIMLFFPYTSGAGAWIITGNSAIDIGEWFYNKKN
jgi:RHS repeat-associated protein